MILCKVTGTVVAPRKDVRFRTSKMLIVHPVDAHGDLDGVKDMLALDPGYGAGIDDIVLVAKEGAVAAQLLGTDAPANVVILGVVDSWAYQA